MLNSRYEPWPLDEQTAKILGSAAGGADAHGATGRQPTGMAVVRPNRRRCYLAGASVVAWFSHRVAGGRYWCAFGAWRWGKWGPAHRIADMDLCRILCGTPILSSRIGASLSTSARPATVKWLILIVPVYQYRAFNLLVVRSNRTRPTNKIKALHP